MNIAELKKVYEGLLDEKLLNLYKERKDLNPEALPVLTEELKRRNLLHIAEARNPEERTPYNFADEAELEVFVKMRLMEGESLESIHLDLVDHGIDIKKQFHNRLAIEREVIDFHLQQTVEHGKPEHEIRQELANRLGLDEQEIEEIKEKHRASGSSYQLIGIVLMVMGGIAIMLAVSASSLDAFFTGLGFLASGFVAFKKHEALQG